MFALDDGVGSSTSSCSYTTIPAGRWHGLVLAARDDPHHNGVEATRRLATNGRRCYVKAGLVEENAYDVWQRSPPTRLIMKPPRSARPGSEAQQPWITPDLAAVGTTRSAPRSTRIRVEEGHDHTTGGGRVTLTTSPLRCGRRHADSGFAVGSPPIPAGPGVHVAKKSRPAANSRPRGDQGDRRINTLATVARPNTRLSGPAATQVRRRPAPAPTRTPVRWSGVDGASRLPEADRPHRGQQRDPDVVVVKMLATETHAATRRAMTVADPVGEQSHTDEGRGERAPGDQYRLLGGFEPLVPGIPQTPPPPRRLLLTCPVTAGRGTRVLMIDGGHARIGHLFVTSAAGDGARRLTTLPPGLRRHRASTCRSAVNPFLVTEAYSESRQLDSERTAVM